MPTSRLAAARRPAQVHIVAVSGGRGPGGGSDGARPLLVTRKLAARDIPADTCNQEDDTDK